MKTSKTTKTAHDWLKEMEKYQEDNTMIPEVPLEACDCLVEHIRRKQLEWQGVKVLKNNSVSIADALKLEGISLIGERAYLKGRVRSAKLDKKSQSGEPLYDATIVRSTISCLMNERPRLVSFSNEQY